MASLTGTVRVAVTTQGVEGATVTVGARQASTDGSGHFEFTGLVVGPATVRAERAGFLPAEVSVTLTAGTNVHDLILSPATVSVTLSGTVRAAVTAQGLAGAKVTLGVKQVTTDAVGHFQITDLTVGGAMVRAELDGYFAVETQVTLVAGANSRDFTLSPLVQEIFVTGGDAAYVPADVGPLRGVIIALGGPVSSGFVTGQRIAPVGNDPLEASLQQLGRDLRALAKSARVALIGRTTVGMPNNDISDAALLALMQTIAGLSGHPEVADLPVVMFGLSSGSQEAGGFTTRQAGRTIGLLLRVPTVAPTPTNPLALAVPTFIMQAETDAVADNATVRAGFTAARAQHGLWALAVEPMVGHNVASPLGNSVVITWISELLSLRLASVPGSPLVPLSEDSGWLGNQATLDIASWAGYADDRTAASWLLSPMAATSWRLLGTGQ